MNNKHKQLTDQLNETYISKNKDYGDSFSRMVKDYGYIAALLPIANKFHRIEQLVQSDNSPSVKGESLTDSLLDLANYCLMFVMEIGKKNKGE